VGRMVRALMYSLKYLKALLTSIIIIMNYWKLPPAEHSDLIKINIKRIVIDGQMVPIGEISLWPFYHNL